MTLMSSVRGRSGLSLTLSMVMLPKGFLAPLGLARKSLLGFPAICIHLASMASLRIAMSLAVAMWRALLDSSKFRTVMCLYGLETGRRCRSLSSLVTRLVSFLRVAPLLLTFFSHSSMAWVRISRLALSHLG